MFLYLSSAEYNAPVDRSIRGASNRCSNLIVIAIENILPMPWTVHSRIHHCGNGAILPTGRGNVFCYRFKMVAFLLGTVTHVHSSRGHSPYGILYAFVPSDWHVFALLFPVEHWHGDCIYDSNDELDCER
jgi:hypothetical protein